MIQELSNQYSTLASALNDKTKKEEYDVSDFGDKSIQTPSDDEIVNRPAIISRNE